MKDFRQVGRNPDRAAAARPVRERAAPAAPAAPPAGSGRRLAGRVLVVSGIAFMAAGMVLAVAAPEGLPTALAETLGPILVVVGFVGLVIGRAFVRAARRAGGG